MNVVTKFQPSRVDSTQHLRALFARIEHSTIRLPNASSRPGAIHIQAHEPTPPLSALAPPPQMRSKSSRDVRRNLTPLFDAMGSSSSQVWACRAVYKYATYNVDTSACASA